MATKTKTGLGAGRPRKPDEEKKKRGTYKPSRSTKPEVGVVILDYGEPILPLNSEGMAIYKDICQVLVDYKIGKNVDVYPITIIAKAWQDYLTVVDLPTVEYNITTGLSAPSGAFKVRKSLESTIMDNLMRLGIPPPARMKLRATPKGDDDKPKDDMEGYMD